MSAYAGIGSRRTPDDVLRLMSRLAAQLYQRSWVLRTGGADGADDAFLSGLGHHDARLELYLHGRASTVTRMEHLIDPRPPRTTSLPNITRTGIAAVVVPRLY